MSASAQTARDLRAAADLIERDGWARGVYRGDDGCRCVLGALVDAIDPEALEPVALSVADGRRYEAAYETMRQAVGILDEWNDHRAESAAEVVATLRRAADDSERLAAEYRASADRLEASTDALADDLDGGETA